MACFERQDSYLQVAKEFDTGLDRDAGGCKRPERDLYLPR